MKTGPTSASEGDLLLETQGAFCPVSGVPSVSPLIGPINKSSGDHVATFFHTACDLEELPPPPILEVRLDFFSFQHVKTGILIKHEPVFSCERFLPCLLA